VQLNRRANGRGELPDYSRGIDRVYRELDGDVQWEKERETEAGKCVCINFYF